MTRKSRDEEKKRLNAEKMGSTHFVTLTQQQVVGLTFTKQETAFEERGEVEARIRAVAERKVGRVQ